MSKNKTEFIHAQHPSGIPRERVDRVTPLVRLMDLRFSGESFGGWGPRIG